MTDIDLADFDYDQTIVIAASPAVLHEMISDVTRMGEWSPTNTGGVWDDDAHVWFVGRNEMPGRVWKTRCRVEVNKPGAEFAFVVCGQEAEAEYIRWSYEFTPTDDGAEVTESWQLLPDYLTLIADRYPDDDHVAILKERREWAADAIDATLTSLKLVAELSR